MKLLENKVAIITGAGSGIGKAAEKLFVAEGANVISTGAYYPIDGGYLAQ